MAKKNTTNTWDTALLRKTIIERMSLEDVKNCAYDLEVPYDDLPVEGKNAKVRELIEVLVRSRRLDKLIEWIKDNRPDIDLTPCNLVKRDELLRFLGVEDSRRIMIYLSNLDIRPGRALGIDNLPRSFSGSAVPAHEMKVANQFLDVANVQVHLAPSPRTQDEVDKSVSFISLGSPAYNAASAYIETALQPHAYFDLARGVMVIKEKEDISDPTWGFVQRIVHRDNSNRRCIFYAAGLSEKGTVGAANFLALNLVDLQKSYGDNIDFLVLLHFDQPDSLGWSEKMDYRFETPSLTPPYHLNTFRTEMSGAEFDWPTERTLPPFSGGTASVMPPQS